MPTPVDCTVSTCRPATVIAAPKRGAWLLVVTIVVFVAAGIAHNAVIRELFLQPGDSPALPSAHYFARSDVALAACHIAALLVVVPFGLWGRAKISRTYGSMVVWFSLLWSGPLVARGLYNLARASDLLERSEALPWATASAYQWDGWAWAVQGVVVVVALVVAAGLHWSDPVSGLPALRRRLTGGR